MDFAFSEEQDALRASAREWLEDTVPLDRVAELADGPGGVDAATWRRLVDLGWVGLSLPEEGGGAGYGLLEEAVVAEETGRALLPAPWFSSVGLALPALAAASDASALQAVLAGERAATLAWAEDRVRVTLDDVDAVAVSADGRGRLSGRKRFVPDLRAGSDLPVDVVVVARGTDGGPALHLVAADDLDGVVVPRSTVDRTRPLADLTLDGTPSRLLVAGDEARGVLRSTRSRALALLACEAVGATQRCLDLTAAYTGQREAFGKPIGAYQAVAHSVADVFVELQLARSLAYWAAWAVSVGDEQAPTAVAAAKAAAGEAAVDAAERCIQAHGGIGFTWDSPLHRFYKRAQGIDAFEGSAAAHRAEIAGVLLDA